MPVTWNIGTTPSATVAGLTPAHSVPVTSTCITERWVWMQPFDLPVVPDVYGITHQSSGPARCGSGTRPAAIASSQRVTCALGSVAFGARTKSGIGNVVSVVSASE